MKVSHHEMNRPVGLIYPFTALLTALAGALTLASPQAQANETVVWDRQALGQTNYCHNGSPWYWPNNNYWSQSQVMGDPCSEGTVVLQPSNWSTTNYPNGANYDVILGSQGGAPANLDLQVTLNSLTIQSDGGLTMHNNSQLAANAFVFQGDGGVTLSGGTGSSPVITLANNGTMTKSGGTGTFALDPGMVLTSYGGHFSVASGTLALPGNGSYYTNGDFAIASGATLALMPASQNITFAGLFSGSGVGTVSMNAGTLAAGSDGATLNLPGSLFQWTGGTMVSMANQGTITISGSVYVANRFYNYGLVHHTNTATLGIRGNAYFENDAGGAYNLEGDGGIVLGGGNGSDPYFQNYGLLRKSGGSGTSTISIHFYNQNGSIEVDSGTLNMSSGAYSQGTGTLTVKLGGRGAGQSGQLSVSSGASLSGPLNVSLTNGFAPVPGDQFQILSSSGRSGTFTTLNVPAGISVAYSNNGVYLVVTSTVPAQILSPQMTGGNFTFSVGTATNQSYTVQQNTNLATTNWNYYTNITGNGSLMQIVAPVTNTAMQFFRVQEP